MAEVYINMEICDGMSAEEKLVKRSFDVIASFLGLIMLSPLFLLIFIMLKLQGRGAVIFKQERIGYKGQAFYIYKFRTMVPFSEHDGKPRLAKRRDRRLTPVGKFLREHHLDELPQLWNVLKGDMSFVGPRPERKYFIEQIMKEDSDYEYIYMMRPGLTSMATLYNGYTDTMEKMLTRLHMDLDYLERRSLALDAKIIFTTAKFIINGKKF